MRFTRPKPLKRMADRKGNVSNGARVRQEIQGKTLGLLMRFFFFFDSLPPIRHGRGRQFSAT